MEGFSDEFYDRWEHLLNAVEIKTIPMRMLAEIIVHMVDGAVFTFDIQELRFSGATTEEIEHLVQAYMLENDERIENLDFKISIENLAEEVESATHNMLK